MSDTSNQHSPACEWERVSFTLGHNLPLLRDIMSWLKSPEAFDSRRPVMIRAFDLPDQFLHPFQGIPSDWGRRQRKTFLQQLMVISNAVKSIQMLDNDSLSRPINVLLLEFATLFDQLEQVENDSAPKSEEQLDDRDKSLLEKDRSHIEASVLELLKQLNDRLDRITSMIPESFHAFFTLGEKAAGLRAEIESSIDTATDPSNKDIGHLQQRILRFADEADHCTSRPIRHELKPVNFSLQDAARIFDEILRKINESFDSPAQQIDCPNGNWHSFPKHPDFDEPQDADGWEELAKYPVKLCGIDIIGLEHQHKLVLTRLLYIPGMECVAGDLALAFGLKGEMTQDLRQYFSQKITKLEGELSKQLGITLNPASKRNKDRIIQHGLGHDRYATYSISLERVEKLVVKKL